jgi:hypothetical protein
MMKLRNTFFLCIAFVITTAVYGEKIKQIRLKQDDAQRYLVSKVYELKHVMACNITPFIEGAVKRYNVDSNVQRLIYTKGGNKEFLVVSTGQAMIPYVDEMIKKLDRPGKKDASGSLIKGTGISRFVYFPKHRTSEAMGTIIRRNLIYETGKAYVDMAVSMVYWKCSQSRGDQILRWISELDRPLPQVQLVMKVYEIRDSDLRELGIDYVAWKNGPGLDLFGGSFDLLSLDGLEIITDFITTNGFEFLADSFGGYGAMFFAPQIDFSFLKIMEQNGSARIATSGAITMVNNPDGSYNIKFSPDFQNIVKTNKDKTTVEASTGSKYTLDVNGPIICFKSTGKHKVFESSDGRRYDEEQESKVDGTIMFNYNLNIESPVEHNNLGSELTESAVFDSNLTLDVGAESLLATWDKTTDVIQETGMPFLSTIPIIKYIFGTEDKIKVTSKYIVTVRADWILPDSELAGWAGKVLTTNQIVEQMPKPARELDYEPKLRIDIKAKEEAQKTMPVKELKKEEKKPTPLTEYNKY